MASLASWKTPSMLLNLPNEVLSQIVAELTSDELMNTVLSCKTLYNFCKDNGDLERHLNHQKAYTVLNLGSQGMDPLDLYEKLDNDWRVAHYVKAVHFKAPVTGPLFARKSHGGVRHLMNMTDFTSQAMLALLEPLLLVLPNLGRLRFIDFARQPPGLKELVKNVGGRAVLTKLEVVEFVKSEEPTDLEIDWTNDASSFKDAFHPWASIPSVHTLRAENIIWDNEFAVRRYRITTLELVNCSIEIEGLARFLDCCENLKRFTYDWNLGESVNAIFREHGLFYTLRRCCGESLEYFRLTGGLPSLRPIMHGNDVRDLRRLKQAHLSLELFINWNHQWEDWGNFEGCESPEWRLAMLPLHEILPSSIEEITIDFRKKGRKRELKELLRCLVSNKYSRSRLPVLKSVVVQSEKLTRNEFKELTNYWKGWNTTLAIELRIVDVW